MRSQHTVGPVCALTASVLHLCCKVGCLVEYLLKAGCQGFLQLIPCGYTLFLCWDGWVHRAAPPSPSPWAPGLLGHRYFRILSVPTGQLGLLQVPLPERAGSRTNLQSQFHSVKFVFQHQPVRKLGLES